MELELHTIELKKFRGNAKAALIEIVDKIANSLDMWTTFLSRNDLLNADTLPEKIDDPLLKKAINVLEIMNFTSEERTVYEDHINYLRIEASAMELTKEDSRMKSQIKVVTKMLKHHFSTEEILTYSELSREEIENLRKGISE